MQRLLLLNLLLTAARRLRALESESFMCNIGSFLCADGRQVPLCLRCDGQPDCADGGDERGCRDGNISCGHRGRQCDGGGPCLPWERFCDGHWDCPGGSDESAGACGHPTTASQPACQKDYFRCAPDVPCFTLAWVCDGHPDCLDARDEWGCGLDLTPEPSVTPAANYTESTVAPEINYKKETVMLEVFLLPLFALMAVVVAVVAVMGVRAKAKSLLANLKPDKAAERLMLQVQP